MFLTINRRKTKIQEGDFIVYNEIKKTISLFRESYPNGKKILFGTLPNSDEIYLPLVVDGFEVLAHLLAYSLGLSVVLAPGNPEGLTFQFMRNKT